MCISLLSASRADSTPKPRPTLRQSTAHQARGPPHLGSLRGCELVRNYQPLIYPPSLLRLLIKKRHHALGHVKAGTSLDHYCSAPREPPYSLATRDV